MIGIARRDHEPLKPGPYWRHELDTVDTTHRPRCLPECIDRRFLEALRRARCVVPAGRARQLDQRTFRVHASRRIACLLDEA